MFADVNKLKFSLPVCVALFAFTGTAMADSAEVLQTKYQTLAGALQENTFKRPLVLSSIETPGRLTGDIYALVEQPFTTLGTALTVPEHWCDVISLHMNTKYCRAMTTSSGSKLLVRIGNKTPEELSQAARIVFDYSAPATTPRYMSVALAAKAGPLGTSDYRIALEAVPLPGGKTFVHLSYSYSVSLVGRIAMQSYLATAGSGKVGFTVVGQRPDGEPAYVGGVRGVVERNTMRYFVGIESLLDAMPAPPAARFERRLQSWFAAIERYPLQLHDMELGEYLAMKRGERAREQSVEPDLGVQSAAN